jgi:hypothetical protein
MHGVNNHCYKASNSGGLHRAFARLQVLTVYSCLLALLRTCHHASAANFELHGGMIGGVVGAAPGRPAPGVPPQNWLSGGSPHPHYVNCTGRLCGGRTPRSPGSATAAEAQKQGHLQRVKELILTKFRMEGKPNVTQPTGGISKDVRDKAIQKILQKVKKDYDSRSQHRNSGYFAKVADIVAFADPGECRKFLNNKYTWQSIFITKCRSLCQSLTILGGFNDSVL